MEPRRVLPDALASPEGLGVTFSGVTICVLTLMSIQPSSMGDTLLLTRLERGSTPITIHIPTALTKVREGLEAWSSWDEPGAGLTAPFLPQAPLSSVLSDFDTIQKEQKETISCTNKREWWLCRSELDRRMKVGKRHPPCLGGMLGPPCDSVLSRRASSTPWRRRCWAAGRECCSPPARSLRWPRKLPTSLPSSVPAAGGARTRRCSRC